MPTPLTALEVEALKSRLADRLLASVHADPDIEAAWAAEVERRIAAVENGAPLIAAEAALARANHFCA